MKLYSFPFKVWIFKFIWGGVQKYCIYPSLQVLPLVEIIGLISKINMYTKVNSFIEVPGIARGIFQKIHGFP